MEFPPCEQPKGCGRVRSQVSLLAMTREEDLEATLKALFDAERGVRRAHDTLVDAEPTRCIAVLERAARQALALDELDEDEASLRLVRIAAVLGEMQGSRVVDLLIDVLGSDEPEARHAAGEALSGISFDRFKDVALGVERALDRLPDGNPALAELPYLLAEVPEPGVFKLLDQFLRHHDADAVAAAIEALVDMGDASAVALIEPLVTDTRRVELEGEAGAEAEASLGELAIEALGILGKRGST